MRPLTPRLIVAASVVMSTMSTPALAQTQTQYPYGLDPYKPSDAALLRDYGATLVGQTPLLELRKLDPYVPSQAAVLRQIGGAMPLWGWWYGYVPAGPGPTSAPLTPFARTETSPASPAAAITQIPQMNRLSPPLPLGPKGLDELLRPLPRPFVPARPGPGPMRRAGDTNPSTGGGAGHSEIAQRSE